MWGLQENSNQKLQENRPQLKLNIMRGNFYQTKAKNATLDLTGYKGVGKALVSIAPDKQRIKVMSQFDRVSVKILGPKNKPLHL